MSNERGRRPEDPSQRTSSSNAAGRVGGGPTTRHLQRRHSAPPVATEPPAAQPDPGASTLTMADLAFAHVFGMHLDPVQRIADAAGPDDDVRFHATAAAGVAGAASPLPHRDQIQRAFGPDHDVGRITAAVGGPAATAAAAIGATAYATGDRVAFAAPPDLHTAAHEAAHVIQQQAGVHLAGGVGRAGDAYEVHADAVADLVVAGQSAADLLRHGPGGSGGGPTVQRKGAGDADAEPKLEPFDLSAGADSPLRRGWPMLRRAAARARTMELQLDTTPQIPIALTAAFATFLKEGTEAAQLLASIPASDPAATAISRREIHAELTKLARSSFVVVRRLGYRNGGATVADALAELGVAAASLGWALPTSPEEAAARAHADEPCESDVFLGLDPRAANPERCHLTVEARLNLRNKIESAIDKADSALSVVLTRHQERLQDAIAADEKFAEKVTEWLIDALVTIATAGAGKGAGVAVAQAATDAGLAALKKMLIEISTKIATGTLKTIVGELVPLAHAGATDNAARVRTMAMAGAVGEAGAAQLDGLLDSLEALDDAGLDSLLAGLEVLTVANIDQRVAPILLAYESQVAPIGDTSVTPARLFPPSLPRRVTKKAIRVAGGEAQHLALVEYEEDVAPGLRRAGRATLAAAADVPRQMRGSRLVDGPQRMLADEWVNDPAVEIRFVQWIESPAGANFEAALADDAPLVPSWRISGLPLFTPKGAPSQ